MDRVIAKRQEGKAPVPDAFDVLFDLLIEHNGSVGTTFAHHTEEDMILALTQSWCSIGSDGSALATEGPLRRGNPHPRSFGTFPRALGVYARDRGVLRLEDAVRKMTSLNAAKIGIKNRGLLQPGFFADITIFDPKKIIDHATYEDPFQYAEGVHYVLVNGKVVLDNGVHTGAQPGRALRHEPTHHASKDSADIFPMDAELEEIPNVTHAGEGPSWDIRSRALYFTGGNRITRLHADGKVEVFREPSGGSNGLLFDREGRLVACESAQRRITRTDTLGKLEILTDNFEGKKFNSPNDVAIDASGRIYFTDPRYGPRDTMEIRDANGRLVEGVYRIDAPGKVTRIVAGEVERPNCILVSPDKKHLFVDDNNYNNLGRALKLYRFYFKFHRSISPPNRKLMFDVKYSCRP